MISGACIFVSMYPYHLRNVYTGNEKVWPTSIYWTTVRQMLIPMGVWLFIGVNTYPAPLALASPGYTKLWCIALHGIGAGTVFVGYTVCEMKCLGLLGFRRRDDFLAIEGKERHVRTLLAYMIVVFFCLFATFQCLIVFGPRYISLCCADVWGSAGMEAMQKTQQGLVPMILEQPQLLDTATGYLFLCKVASFICEDVFVMSMVFSHIAIWYYCEERHVEYGDTQLKEVYKQDP
mmetsp:Transcript_135777/g.290356  ORF Transcript_135777/g.290356 Transcript_135777/m.290356 type:complete len:234 (-) Transcript_135777:149-850(-)